MKSRRSFISEIVVGFSAAIFTPHLIVPGWKNTIKAIPEFVPHWAIVTGQWIEELGRQHLKSLAPPDHIFMGIPMLISNNDSYVWLSHPMHEQIYEPIKNQHGVLIEPIVHLPNGFSPPNPDGIVSVPKPVHRYQIGTDFDPPFQKACSDMESFISPLV